MSHQQNNEGNYLDLIGATTTSFETMTCHHERRIKNNEEMEKARMSLNLNILDYVRPRTKQQ